MEMRSPLVKRSDLKVENRKQILTALKNERYTAIASRGGQGESEIVTDQVMERKQCRKDYSAERNRTEVGVPTTDNHFSHSDSTDEELTDNRFCAATSALNAPSE